MSGEGGHTRSLSVLAVIDSLAQGGAERSLVDLIGPLRERGVEIDVVTLHGDGVLAAEAVEAGAQVHVLDAGGRAGRIWVLAEMIANRGPDLVHTTLFESHVAGRLAARVARAPVTSSVVGTPYGPDHRAQPGLAPMRVRGAQVVDALTARLVTRFHTPAGHVADTMVRRLALPPHRIDVVPRGRDQRALGRRSEARRRQARAALGDWLRGGDRPLLVVVAREEPVKGIDVAVEALGAWAPDDRPRLAVVGRAGAASHDLRDLVRRRGLEADVRFLGYRSDVAELLCAADVAVLPSRREGLPGVLLEALALEAPVVASDLPGVREVVGPSTGVLVRPDDPAALADAVRSVLTHPSEARRRAGAGRRRFEARFAIDRSADGMAAFFRRAAS